MKDRFKFRVWNKKYNCYDFCRRKFGILYIQEKFRVSSGYDGEDHPTFCEDVNENYIIEQCTGLKDKNGNLIYEGDLIKSPNNSHPLIISYNRSGLWECKENRINGLYELPLYVLADKYQIEIIGNIHENKGE